MEYGLNFLQLSISFKKNLPDFIEEIIYFLSFFFYLHVHQFLKTPQIVALFLRKNIYGINTQKKLKKNGELQFIFSLLLSKLSLVLIG